ncbi:unnamed protein product [Brassica rapa subsp. narinosa]
MCRPSQTPHLTMSSARIDAPKRVLGLKEVVVTPPLNHEVSKITRTRVKLNRVFFPRRFCQARSLGCGFPG